MRSELYQQMRGIEDQHWWFRGRRKIVSSLLDKLPFPTDCRILDLGCGTGGNLAMLAKHGEVVGVELDENARRLANDRGIAPVQEGRLPHEIPLEDGHFHCVTMLDVLEHVEEEEAALRTVSQKLAPGGFLLLTVPAFQFLWGPHDEEHHHFRRYRAPELRSRLEKAGFELDRLTYFNTWLFPLIAAVRLVRRWFPGGEAGVEGGLPPKLINRFLFLLFSSERFLITRTSLPFGVSLCAVARKTDHPPTSTDDI